MGSMLVSCGECFRVVGFGVKGEYALLVIPFLQVTLDPRFSSHARGLFSEKS